jgi:hypothetical protein
MFVFMFTDIEGSTQLWERHKTAMSKALARHDEIITGRVKMYGGHIAKHTGDGMFVVFTGGDPLQCALGIQRDFAVEAWDLDDGLHIRIGLHLGEAEGREQECFGPAVNRAARVMDAAMGEFWHYEGYHVGGYSWITATLPMLDQISKPEQELLPRYRIFISLNRPVSVIFAAFLTVINPILSLYSINTKSPR